jgi:hypothetical protein
MLKQDPKAWRQGFAAAKRGDRPDRCPYHANTRESKSWNSGYAEGKNRSSTR